MVMNDIETIREKVDFFLNSNIKVHIDLTDGTFLNGIIIKKTKEDVYWLEERKLGRVFLFVREIKTIQEYREVRG